MQLATTQHQANKKVFVPVTHYNFWVEDVEILDY